MLLRNRPNIPVVWYTGSKILRLRTVRLKGEVADIIGRDCGLSGFAFVDFLRFIIASWNLLPL